VDGVLLGFQAQTGGALLRGTDSVVGNILLHGSKLLPIWHYTNGRS
jgi:hypothetical protein